MNNTILAEGEITNTCTCVDDNENPIDCHGDCWEWAVDNFVTDTSDFFNSNPTDYWRIKNLKLWAGEVSGVAHCKTPQELLRAMTVDSEWTMRYSVYADKLEYSLSHHDAPTGSSTVVTTMTEEEAEEL
jgi:hypothetical protein